jgi:N-formylglutamate amidohydrolase
MILHIPHSSHYIPPDAKYLLSDDDLTKEIVLLSDHYCDDLFAVPDAERIVFPYCRVYCDVERFFPVDPMDQYGMGMYYTKTFDGRDMRLLEQIDYERVHSVYRNHHQQLRDAVNKELAQHGLCLIVDCHSFSAYAVHDHANDYPDICIGTDPFHTPSWLADALCTEADNSGYSVAFNDPFGGCIVPMEHYEKDRHVHSVMIEINRSMYLQEDLISRSEKYYRTKEVLNRLMQAMKKAE